jgi:hypothetical protein
LKIYYVKFISLFLLLANRINFANQPKQPGQDKQAKAGVLDDAAQALVKRVADGIDDAVSDKVITDQASRELARRKKQIERIWRTEKVDGQKLIFDKREWEVESVHQPHKPNNGYSKTVTYVRLARVFGSVLWKNIYKETMEGTLQNQLQAGPIFTGEPTITTSTSKKYTDLGIAAIAGTSVLCAIGLYKLVK